MLRTIERKKVKEIRKPVIFKVCTDLLPVNEGRKYLTTRVDICYHDRFAALTIRSPKEFYESSEQFIKELKEGVPTDFIVISEATVTGERDTIYGEVSKWKIDELFFIPARRLIIPEAKLFLVSGKGKRTTWTAGDTTVTKGEVIYEWHYESRTGMHWEELFLVEAEDKACLKETRISGAGNVRTREFCVNGG
jgi:hypothetical protein